MNDPLYPLPPAYTTVAKTNALSIISMISGILGALLICPSFFVPLLLVCGSPLSLAALIMGFISLNQIKKSSNQEKGRGMAIAGVVLGALVTLGACVYGVLVLLVMFGAVTIPIISNSIPTY